MADLVVLYDRNHRFTEDDIFTMHKIWLGTVYEWAGKYRQVNISKAGFLFAAAGQIPKLMAAFEKDILQKYTPCTFASINDVVTALAVVHGTRPDPSVSRGQRQAREDADHADGVSGRPAAA